MTFVGLVFHNLGTRRFRTALTAVAVAIAVMTVVTLNVVTRSLQTSAAEVLSLGNADFIVAQKQVADVLASTVTEEQLANVKSTPGVHSAVGVLVSAIRLNATNPLFIQIGVNPAELPSFGVHVVAGRPYGVRGPNEIMLGWEAAQNLHKSVGDTLKIGTITYTVVGIYTINQTFGNTAAMFPLTTLQANTRKPGTVTLVAVKVTKGVGSPRSSSGSRRTTPTWPPCDWPASSAGSTETSRSSTPPRPAPRSSPSSSG